MAESVAIDITHIEKIKKESYLNTEFTPYEVYLKFLLEYFGRSIDFDPNSVSDLPKGYKKLSYQVDAVMMVTQNDETLTVFSCPM